MIKNYAMENKKYSMNYIIQKDNLHSRIHNTFPERLWNFISSLTSYDVIALSTSIKTT